MRAKHLEQNRKHTKSPFLHSAVFKMLISLPKLAEPEQSEQGPREHWRNHRESPDEGSGSQY